MINHVRELLFPKPEKVYIDNHMRLDEQYVYYTCNKYDWNNFNKDLRNIDEPRVLSLDNMCMINGLWTFTA